MNRCLARTTPTRRAVRLAMPVMTVLMSLLLLGMFGCTSPERDVRLSDVQLPWDLSVQIHVQGHDDAGNPMEQTSQFILEPSRKLRVATGPGADSNYYPQVTRVISPEQYEQVGRLVREFNLQVEPSSPTAQAAATQPGAKTLPIYHVSIQAFGRRNQYATTPRESPPTAQLLAMLVQLRGETVSTGSRTIEQGNASKSIVGLRDPKTKRKRESVAP